MNTVIGLFAIVGIAVVAGGIVALVERACAKSDYPIFNPPSYPQGPVIPDTWADWKKRGPTGFDRKIRHIDEARRQAIRKASGL